ncbi:MAG: hypothetical protein WCC97_18695 [Candidatus Acidiferrales bacterium]
MSNEKEPGAMSQREVFEKSREFWDPAKNAGKVGLEGTPVPPPTRLPAAEYSAPASNLPGPQSVAALKSRSAEWGGGNSKLRPSTLPPPGV